jgi:hypothetical protein
MLRRTVLFAIFIISLVTIITSCTEVTQQLPPSMEAQLALLPENANALGYANVKKIHESDFVNIFLDSSKAHPFHDEEYQNFVTATGLDLEKDISEVYFAANLGEHPHEKDGLVVIYGNFDADKITKYIENEAKEHNLTKKAYDEYEIFQLTKDDTITFSFINGTTLLVGSENNITTWIDKSTGKSEKTENDLISEVDKLKYNETAWFIMDATLLTKELKKKDIKKLKSLESLKNISVSMNLVDKFKVFGESEFKSSEQAELFYDAIKGFIAAGKLSTSDDRDFVDLLNSIEVNHENEQVTINIEFSKDDIEKLLNMKDSIAPNLITAL